MFRCSYDLEYRIFLSSTSSFLFLIINVSFFFKRSISTKHAFPFFFRFAPRGRNILHFGLLIYQIGIFTKKERKKLFSSEQTFFFFSIGSFGDIGRLFFTSVQRILLGSGFLPRDFRIVRKSNFYGFLSITLK